MAGQVAEEGRVLLLLEAHVRHRRAPQAPLLQGPSAKHPEGRARLHTDQVLTERG